MNLENILNFSGPIIAAIIAAIFTAAFNWFFKKLDRESSANQLTADDIKKLHEAFSHHNSFTELQKDLIAQSLLSTKASFHENQYFLEKNFSLKETRTLRKFEKNMVITFNPFLWKYELTGFWKYLDSRFTRLSMYLRWLQLAVLYLFLIYAALEIINFLYVTIWSSRQINTGFLMIMLLVKIVMTEAIAIGVALYFKRRSDLIKLLKYKC